MRNKGSLVAVAVVVVLYVLVEATRPTPVDWTPSYERDDARPLGAAALFRLLPRWLSSPDVDSVAVEAIEKPPFVHLGDSTLVGTTYLFLTRDFSPDEEETRRLLAYASRGNAVVAIATTFDGPLADSLGLPDDVAYEADQSPGIEAVWEGGAQDSVLALVSPGLDRPGGYRFPLRVQTHVFYGLDPARATVLGRSADGAETLARITVGKGQFVLSTNPDAFSNAALVGEGDGAAYVAGVLAHVPAQRVFWDEHYKPSRAGSSSPLRFVLQHPSLRWAYGLAVVGFFLFVAFRGRRWQRAVPVVAAPPNAAREFARTVGRLYHQHGDGAALARRKTRHFLDRLRTRFGLTDLDLTDATAARVAVRTGANRAETLALFARLRYLSVSETVAADDLVALDHALALFLSQLD